MSRRRIEKILAVVSYFSGFDAVCRFLTRGRKRVIMYHNVLPESLMRKDVANSFTTSEAEFRRDIRYFKGKYGISNDMNDAERVAISFDDGFKSQGEIVCSSLLLSSASLPSETPVSREAALGGQADPLLRPGEGLGEALQRETNYGASWSSARG